MQSFSLYSIQRAKKNTHLRLLEWSKGMHEQQLQSQIAYDREALINRKAPAITAWEANMLLPNQACVEKRRWSCNARGSLCVTDRRRGSSTPSKHGTTMWPPTPGLPTCAESRSTPAAGWPHSPECNGENVLAVQWRGMA